MSFHLININLNNFLVFFKTFYLIVNYLIITVLILICIAFYTLAERKIMAAIQRRKGPNLVGIWGLLQPLADGFKLIIKSKFIPRKANAYLFSAAPVIILVLSLITWIFISLTANFNFIFNDMYIYQWFNLNLTNQKINIFFNSFFYNNNNFINHINEIYINLLDYFLSNSQINFISFSVSILCILAISSFNVYGIILSGWSSNSKYAFFGSLRSAAQMISYEVSIGLTILPVILLIGNTLNLNNIVTNYFILKKQFSLFFLLPCVLIFFISMLAETNRTPFDLTEAEAELVAGYNVEYSSITFAMFFLAEYSNMILMSTLFCIFFLGNYYVTIFIIYILVIMFLFVLVRATFPRYKYNELMDLGWKVFLPIALSFYIYICCILIYYYAQLNVFFIQY